jgi:hypothetical protein
MLDTARNQPMRVCAAASGFSMRTLGIANGTLITPMPSSSACSFFPDEGREDGRRHAAVQPGDWLALHRLGQESSWRLIGRTAFPWPKLFDYWKA